MLVKPNAIFFLLNLLNMRHLFQWFKVLAEAATRLAMFSTPPSSALWGKILVLHYLNISQTLLNRQNSQPDISKQDTAYPICDISTPIIQIEMTNHEHHLGRKSPAWLECCPSALCFEGLHQRLHLSSAKKIISTVSAMCGQFMEDPQQSPDSNQVFGIL